MDELNAQIRNCMYQYSRAIYRTIKDLIDPYADPDEQLEYRRSETTGEISFFNRDDQSLRSCKRKQQSSVERFDEPRVDDSCFDLVFREVFGCGQ